MKLARTSSQRLFGPGQLDDGFQGLSLLSLSQVDSFCWWSMLLYDYVKAFGAGEAFTVLEQPRNNNNTQSPYSPVKVAHTYSCQSKFDGKGRSY